MRFHVPSLPHTQTTKDFVWCAYTAKVVRFCNMMTSLGHEVFLYGGTENEAICNEFIEVVTDEDRAKWFSGYDWSHMVFDEWNHEAECWRVMNARVSSEIAKRKQPGDFLCIIVGQCQAAITAAHSDMRAVEWGIGYEGILDNTFHVFESNPWMHYVYGKKHISDGRFFDTVIPNSFDDYDYTFSDKKEDYFLYLGRPTAKKGLEVVQHLAKSHKVIGAGQGLIEGIYHVGVVRGAHKANLLAKAKAVLVPTFYIEPFGGVAVEAMLSGTPVITTDFGAFTETVRHGVDGFRCHTLGEFERAARDVSGLDPVEIRRNAERYLTKNVRHEYDAYFKRLCLLDGKGWYECGSN